MTPTSPLDARSICVMGLLHPKDVLLQITTACEALKICGSDQDDNPIGRRQSSFKLITRSLEVAQYPQALTSILQFTQEYRCFNLDELAQVEKIERDRVEELHEQAESIRQSHILIEYDCTALRTSNLSEDLRAITTARIKASEMTVAHDMAALGFISRGLGIIGSIVLDQRSVCDLPSSFWDT